MYTDTFISKVKHIGNDNVKMLRDCDLYSTFLVFICLTKPTK